MKALVAQASDEPPRIMRLATPRPGTGEVAIAVEACALNFADLLMLKGEYQEQPSFPLIPGMEVAGTVTATGAGVASDLQGQRVMTFVGQGGLAETAISSADRLVPLPTGMAAVEAAAIPVAYGTSHLALTRTARLGKDETLLVLGAAGGVGLTAVELGRHLGATVIASARGAAKCEVARAAGAHHVIDSDAGELTEAVRALGGADVVYDPVGGPSSREALRVTKPEGRLLLIGFASGTLPDLRPNHLLVKNVSVHGFYWGGFLKFDPAVLFDSLRDVMALYGKGLIRPHVSHVVPLDDAAGALEILRQRKSTGKVVITI